MIEYLFPEDFLWGTAASAYQVEGGNSLTDWHDLETDDAKKPPHKRRIKEPCGKACDHWNRHEEDYDLARELGVQIHRLSVDWARVFPEQNCVNETAMEHYRKMLLALRERRIKVMLCLNHFTLPRWAAERGGYANPQWLLPHFSRYADAVVRAFGDLVDYWLPINEPNVVPLGGYLTGIFPPFRHNPVLFARVYRTFFQLHACSYQIIKARFPRAPVGVAFSFFHFQPYRTESGLDRWGTATVNTIANLRFFEGIQTGRVGFPLGWGGEVPGLKGAMDFIGLNYYSSMYMRGLIPLQSRPGDLVTDMGWIFYPRGIYENLIYLKEHSCLPVIVTENGVATTDENFRIRYMKAHLEQVHRAVTDGAPVKGYMCWSLTDNFEWHHGYSMRFGLIHIDYATQKRTVKEGGRWFARVIENNSICQAPCSY